MELKPAYRISSMDEIRLIKPNGYNVISTFSGCGGSSLGYRMAGFKVLWANEFIPSARDSYNANKADYTIVDSRDIRKVDGVDILQAIKMQPGELDLFDGSPPCASFSTAGKRSIGWGHEKKYSDTVQRTDDLFFEYVRLLRQIKPKTFVAENVSGLVKGVAKGYFLEILKELKDSGYDVSAKLLNAMWLGVPQNRQRIIFVGVRNDIGVKPCHPRPFGYYYTLQDAINNISEVSGNSCYKQTFKDAGKYPANTITATISNKINKVIRIDDNEYREKLTPRMAKWWQKTKQGHTLNEGHAIAENLKQASGMTKSRLSWKKTPPTILAGGGGTCDYFHPDIPESMTISEIKRISSFPDDFILKGTFKEQWERIGRAVPPIMMMHIANAVKEGCLDRIKA
jgi:DNA (cytosine-5)-methyltransferase 1